MRWTLVFCGSDFVSLRERLLAWAPREAGAILRCFDGGPGRLLVFSVSVASDADVSNRSPSRLEFTPEFVAREVKRAREAGQSLVFVHTHPFSESPLFSAIDDEGEAKLLPAVAARVPGRPHGALVLGTSGFEGRLLAGNDTGAIERIVQVGQERKEWSHGAPPGLVDEVHDRTIRALGAQGQVVLASLRVAVVGAGGTGSLVVQQLAHLGVGSILVIDHDTLESSNLNRVVGASDSELGLPKAEIAARHARKLGGGRVEARGLVASVIDATTVDALLAYDLVFGCTDTHGSRAILNLLAYQYLIPCIDMGVRIDSNEGALRSIAGRVQLLSPGVSCLQCQNLLDPGAVRAELMSEAQRQVDPYIVGEAVPQPAVISLNSTVASLAVTLFLGVVAGLPVAGRQLAYRALDSQVRRVGHQQVEGCVVCSASRGALARGASWPLPIARTR